MPACGRAIGSALSTAVVALVLGAATGRAQVTRDVPTGNPASVVDLATVDGATLLGAHWRYHDADIVEVAHRAVGPDLKASGAPNRTHDIEPHAGAREFDDSAWPELSPTSLDARRTNGRLSFGWYRTRITVPARIGSLDPAGATLVLEVVVDDYSEVWVDGHLATVLGQSGGGLVRGWNAPNRVVLTRDARPGQTIQLAVFGANGPLSDPPANFVWIRSATIEVHPKQAPTRAGVAGGSFERLDPALEAIVAPGTPIERVATGFQFTEGPLWHPDGYLLFSDPNANAIYRLSEGGDVSLFRAKSGYAGIDIGEYHQPGSNGLALDKDGRLAIDEHGRRRVVRLEKNGVITVLADRYDGKRFNSPNDLVYKSDGALYITDPPYGLPNTFQDRRKETPYSGVYRVANGRVTLVASDLKGPNGIAFSPNEEFLYVDNWDLKRKVIMRYPVRRDGSLAEGKVFIDATRSDTSDIAWDGMKIDRAGNLFVAGPGGVWIISPAGKHLGTIVLPELPANVAWGGEDGRTLYITARTSVYRARLASTGIRAAPVIDGATSTESRNER
ncbi:MAG: SMP-30/gluconolactonase/LRE family protein [Gemmatimonadota bacterium]